MEVPYAQLDGVDVLRTCCVCYSVNEQSPGWGCDKGTVDEVAEELQKRSFERGNVAQLAQLEHMLALSQALEAQSASLLPTRPPSSTPPHVDVVEAFQLEV